MGELEKLRKASFRAGYLTIGGVGVVIASLLYSYVQLSGLEREAAKVRMEVEGLRSTQQSLLDFLASVTDARNISILGPDVDWDEVKRQIDGLPAGDRKSAILHAMLLAWKDIPFTMGRESVRGGFDSPRFVRYVLGTVGVEVADKPGEPLSVTLMRQFEKVDDPKPGDLVFFKGQVGYFGFILASVGREFPDHVGIGTLQKIAPLQVIRLGNVNTPYFPLHGYYQVRYPDEQKPANDRRIDDR